MKIIKNDIFDYENRHIYQIESGFKFSLDSILLAEFVDIKSSDKMIVDFCTGNCVVPLILTTKYIFPKYYAFEIDEDIFKLARESIILNKVNNIEVFNDDIKNVNKYFKNNSVNIITCNPPYFKVSKHVSCNRSKAISRHENLINLEDIFRISSKILSNNGVFYMVHRTNRIDEIIILANKYKMNVKEIMFINTKKNNLYTILVKCVKNSKYGVNVYQKSVNNLKTYKNIFREVK